MKIKKGKCFTCLSNGSCGQEDNTTLICTSYIRNNKELSDIGKLGDTPIRRIVRCVALAILEQQKHTQLSPGTIKDLKKIGGEK